MALLGIIAEYNPFHLGHVYQIEQARQHLAPEGVIVIMSGHFSQRGEAAIANKWQRAEWALAGGADLVLELPCAFCCRSANYFAQGAVLSLAQCGITHLVFGAESDNLALLQKTAQLLADEPPLYQAALQDALKKGFSYPKAQEEALKAYYPDTADLWQPNNLLAINYLKILYQQQLSITPFLIQRQGSYHSMAPEGRFASASLLRRMLLSSDSSAYNYLPEFAANIFPAQWINPEFFAPIILALLRRSTPKDIMQIIDITEGLEHKLISCAKDASSLDELCQKVKSKRYTYSRISRSLCHILLNFTQDYHFTAPQYLRVLGFNQTGSQILKTVKKNSALPIITKTAAAKKHLTPLAQKMLQLDIRATDLYYLAYQNAENSFGNQDFYRSPIVYMKS